MGLTIAARLVWLQTDQAPVYAAKAQRVQTDVVTVPAARGSIVDRNGRILAGNRTSLQVAVRPPLDGATVQRLSELAGVRVAGSWPARWSAGSRARSPARATGVSPANRSPC